MRWKGTRMTRVCACGVKGEGEHRQGRARGEGSTPWPLGFMASDDYANVELWPDAGHVHVRLVLIVAPLARLSCFFLAFSFLS